MRCSGAGDPDPEEDDRGDFNGADGGEENDAEMVEEEDGEDAVCGGEEIPNLDTEGGEVVCCERLKPAKDKGDTSLETPLRADPTESGVQPPEEGGGNTL